jgi:hypothetical protein
MRKLHKSGSMVLHFFILVSVAHPHIRNMRVKHIGYERRLVKVHKRCRS